MTGPEHYRAAEGLLGRAREAHADAEHAHDPRTAAQLRADAAQLTAEASAHATLASAAAMALNFGEMAVLQQWRIDAGGPSLPGWPPAELIAAGGGL